MCEQTKLVPIPDFMLNDYAFNYGLLGGRVVCFDYGTEYRVR